MICNCKEPVTDEDLGLDSEEFNFCWRCKRPIIEGID